MAFLEEQDMNSNGTCCDCPAVNIIRRFTLEPCTQAQQEESPDGLYMVAECRRGVTPGLQSAYNPRSVTFDDCPLWSHTDKGYVLKEE